MSKHACLVLQLEQQLRHACFDYEQREMLHNLHSHHQHGCKTRQCGNMYRSTIPKTGRP
jgi:hypothetical protein